MQILHNKSGHWHSEYKYEESMKKCYMRVRTVLKCDLNTSDMILPINSLPVPVVVYSFIVLKWNMRGIRVIDRKSVYRYATVRCTIQRQTQLKGTEI